MISLSSSASESQPSSTGDYDRLTHWEGAICHLLKDFPKSSTDEIVQSLCPHFAREDGYSRAALWSEISTTLSRMLAWDRVNVEVDEVLATHWSLEPAHSTNRGTYPAPSPAGVQRRSPGGLRAETRKRK